VIVFPDSNGIVDCDGVTLTAVIAASVAGAAAGPSSRASRPEAIARHTAWLPAVRCSEITTLSLAGTAITGAAAGRTPCGAATGSRSIARLYPRATRTATMRSSPSRGAPRPSRLEVATHKLPSGAAATVRMRP